MLFNRGMAARPVGEIFATPDLCHQNISPVQGVAEGSAGPGRDGPVLVGWLRLRGVTRVWAPHEGSCCRPETGRSRSTIDALFVAGYLLWAPKKPCKKGWWSEVGVTAKAHIVMGFIPPPALV